MEISNTAMGKSKHYLRKKNKKKMLQKSTKIQEQTQTPGQLKKHKG